MDMTKHTFQMTWDQVDSIIIKELQEAYEMNLHPGTYEGGGEVEPDFHLLKSFEVVLYYYMPLNEYRQWMESHRTKSKHDTVKVMPEGAVGASDTMISTPPGANGGTGPLTDPFVD